MNRRSFFKTLAKAAVGFSILPAATTYARNWKQVESGSLWMPNPSWQNAEFEMKFLVTKEHLVFITDTVTKANFAPMAFTTREHLSGMPIIKHYQIT